MILGFVEPPSRHERLDEIGHEPGQTRLAHLLLPRERDEGCEHLNRLAVALERELEEAERGGGELFCRCSAVVAASSSAFPAASRAGCSSPA